MLDFRGSNSIQKFYVSWVDEPVQYSAHLQAHIKGIWLLFQNVSDRSESPNEFCLKIPFDKSRIYDRVYWNVPSDAPLDCRVRRLCKGRKRTSIEYCHEYFHDFVLAFGLWIQLSNRLSNTCKHGAWRLTMSEIGRVFW